MKSKREEALNILAEVLEMLNKASITLAKSFEETKNLPIDSFTSIDDIEWETLKNASSSIVPKTLLRLENYETSSLTSMYLKLSSIFSEKY